MFDNVFKRCQYNANKKNYFEAVEILKFMRYLLNCRQQTLVKIDSDIESKDHL